MSNKKKVCEAHTYHPDECEGQIKRVIIKQGTGGFILPDKGIEYRYCEEAIRKDRENGYEVIEKEGENE